MKKDKQTKEKSKITIMNGEREGEGGTKERNKQQQNQTQKTIHKTKRHPSEPPELAAGRGPQRWTDTDRCTAFSWRANPTNPHPHPQLNRW